MLTTRLPSKANHSKLSNQGEAVARLSCYVFPKMSKRNISTNGVFSPTSRFLIASIFVAAPVALLLVISPIVNLPVFPAAAQTPQIQSDPRLGRNPALVSPDRIAEVSTLTPDRDNFPELDNFAWRAFVAMNWPALTDPINRGLPDRNKVLSDAGPRVWETFKSRYELFQVDSDGKPVAPQPWATYDAVTPCGTDSNDGLKTLASFDPFMDFNQASNAGTPSSPLVAQNGTYTRYETRLNEEEYGALSRWSHGEDLPNTDNPVQIPAGSIAVKAAWRLLTAADTPAVRARYYVVQNANVVDVAKTIAARHVVCSYSDQNASPATGNLGHVRTCRQRSTGRTQRARRQKGGYALLLFRCVKTRTGSLAKTGFNRDLSSQSWSSAETGSGAEPGCAPASNSSFNLGDEPLLLVTEGDQRNSVGQLYVGSGSVAEPGSSS
jgi:hypothetical protein